MKKVLTVEVSPVAGYTLRLECGHTITRPLVEGIIYRPGDMVFCPRCPNPNAGVKQAFPKGRWT